MLYLRGKRGFSFPGEETHGGGLAGLGLIFGG